MAKPQQQLGESHALKSSSLAVSSGPFMLTCPPPPLCSQIAYSSSSPGNYVVSVPGPSVRTHLLSHQAPLTDMMRLALTCCPFAVSFSFVFVILQGPPGGGGPPGTPIMPSPGGELIPAVYLLFTGQELRLKGPYFLIVIFHWRLGSCRFT